MTKIDKTDEEWQQQLTGTQFQICRKKGTERPFTGEYWSTKRDGVYHCVCCGVALFDSATKYNSGSGWPSFYQPIDAEKISEQTDASRGMSRTEVMCADCGSHLGHVFSDGPEPTGLRYCINSASLNFAENKSTDS